MCVCVCIRVVSRTKVNANELVEGGRCTLIRVAHQIGAQVGKGALIRVVSLVLHEKLLSSYLYRFIW